MLEDHLLESTLISALEHVISRHPANPAPKKKDKRRRLRRKGGTVAELAQVVVEGPANQAPV